MSQMQLLNVFLSVKSKDCRHALVQVSTKNHAVYTVRKQCACTGENQCLECCATDNGECQPLLYQGEYISFPNGVFCTSGFCQSVSHDNTIRTYNYI